MTPDVLIIGGGILGLTIAVSLRRALPDQSVVLLEKEPDCGAHASGRNSGVLHAGFYYSADSLKAAFSVQGNAVMVSWCQEHGVPLRRCGKLVVARDPSEHAGLDELLRRAQVNGVALEAIDEAQAREIEPRAQTAGRALWSPTTASFHPPTVVASVRAEAERLGVVVRTGVAWRGPGRSSEGPLDPGYVINCAGLQADQVARAYGASQHHHILPFKGLYLCAEPAAGALACHIYPVPDLRFPFLGVHFTVTVDGQLKIGPTALPALWRENYRGLERFSASELGDIVGREVVMMATDAGFRRLAWRELRKARRRHLVDLAAGLASGIQPAHWRRWGRPGLRAQLVDLRSRSLVTDFVIEQQPRALHVLNAVSPAFTCAWPFAEHVVQRVVSAQ